MSKPISDDPAWLAAVAAEETAWHDGSWDEYRAAVQASEAVEQSWKAKK